MLLSNNSMVQLHLIFIANLTATHPPTNFTAQYVFHIFLNIRVFRTVIK